MLQAHGESRAYDSAQLINMTTREVLRIKPGMFGEDRFQHLGILPDGTVVIVVRRHLVGPVFLYPKDFWGFLRESGKKCQLEPWRDYQECYPNIPFVIVVRRHLVGPVFLYPKDFWGFLRESGKKCQLEPWRDYQECYPNIPFVLPERSPVSASSEAESKDRAIRADWLIRPVFDTLSISDRTTLMARLAARYGLDFLGLETFEK